MAHLIDKDTLVAEIEKRRKNWWYGSSIEAKYKREECDDILTLIDTLKVKEADLDREIEKCLKQYHMLAVGKKDFAPIARHFFELGMLVSNKAQKGEEV